MTGNSSSYNRCGIVLAGGDGCRLKPFVHQLRGNSLPKQYVNIIGTRSMIEHAFARAEKVIPRERIFTVVNRDHLSHPEARQQLSTRSEGTHQISSQQAVPNSFLTSIGSKQNTMFSSSFFGLPGANEGRSWVAQPMPCPRK